MKNSTLNLIQQARLEIEKDKDCLYKRASNYQTIRTNLDELENALIKLKEERDKTPKWIRILRRLF